jgi:hypothetical protein
MFCYMALFSHPSIYLYFIPFLSIYISQGFIFIHLFYIYHPYICMFFIHQFISFSLVSFLYVSHPVYFFLVVLSCGSSSGLWPRFSSWPRGRDLGISSSAVRSHLRWRSGDGPARLNAGGPLDVPGLGATTIPLSRV